jgi:adenylosuccinate lyase
VTPACLAELAEYLAQPDTDHHDVGSASAIRDLARHYLLLVDEIEVEKRLRQDAERDRKTLMLEMTIGQHALQTAFAGAARCVDALASEHDDLDDADWFARPLGPSVDLLTPTAMVRK